MTESERMARRIADCLEEHLHEYGWEPYRYPSGEHKGVEAIFHARSSDIRLISADQSQFMVEVREEDH